MARGRTRSFDREAALDAAVRLFAERGYAATRIAEICTVVGIATPSFYAAFGSKEAIYREAIERVAAQKGEAIFSAFADGVHARTGIEDVLLRTVDQGTNPLEPPGCLVTLSDVHHDGHPQLGDLVRGKRAVAFDLFKDWLEHAIRCGDLPAGTRTESLARMLTTFQQGIAVQARDGVSRSLLHEAVRAFMTGWPWAGDVTASTR